ncbi:acyltransferase family-domain-containing protein [Biscogniauxia sp. FL1348]|nr:acyltransferase family-domain-containing protein [Biscogniauxia sp. FL1348]
MSRLWSMPRLRPPASAFLPSFLVTKPHPQPETGIDLLGPLTCVVPNDNSQSPLAKEQLRPTSYLDGLRGIAALIVCICHYTENHHEYLTPTYGIHWDKTAGDGADWVSSPIQLPFLRLVFSGRPMVHIFFVISGFALSSRPLAEARARNWGRLQTALSSAAFRRPIRLLGPVSVSTLIIFVLVRLGWLYSALPTLGEQVQHYVKSMAYHVWWPWAWEAHLFPPYDIHLWTIPIELCHSMLLFVVLTMLARVQPRVRMLCSLVFTIYCLYVGKWAAFEFIAGMMLAEYHLMSAEWGLKPLEFPCIRGSQSSEPFTPPGPPIPSDELATLKFYNISPKLAVFKNYELCSHILILAAAGFIGGWPNADQYKTPIIGHMAPWAPSAYPLRDPEGPQKFYFALCAVGVVWSCGRVGLVRRALEFRGPQYLGRISFAIYIMHGMVFDMCHDMVLGQARVQHTSPNWGSADVVSGRGTRGLFGVDTVFGRTACWAGGLVVLLPLLGVSAHLFCVYIDEPIIRLARKVETWCFVTDDKEMSPAWSGGAVHRGNIGKGDEEL